MKSTSACLATVSLAPSASHRSHRLSPRAAFYLEASITLSFLAGSSAPTPLYAIYRAEWGFSATMLTLIFAVYALAVLAALLVVGRLSDHVGRRPVLLAATLAQAATMLLFAHASGLGDLVVARIVQGLSAGAAIAAVGAGLLDLDKARGAVANAVAPMLGTALGAGIAGVLVEFLPLPTELVYALFGALFVAQAIGVHFLAETAPSRPGALASLLPQLGVPGPLRGVLLRVAPAVIAVWSLAGFYASLGPTLVKSLLDSRSVLLGGLALFVLAGSGALAVLMSTTRAPRTLMRFGMLALIAGLATVLAALALRSITLFLLGTAIAGVGFGTGFQGALRTLVAGIDASQRAGVLSMLFVVAYLAMGAPAVLAGLDVAWHGDIVATARVFAGVVMALAALAWLGVPREARLANVPHAA
jgi:MFS family permease